MDEKKQIYNIVLAIWNLFKKYGFQELNDATWEQLINECMKLEKKNKESKLVNRLFRDMYQAVQNYYIGKAREKTEIKGQETLPL